MQYLHVFLDDDWFYGEAFFCLLLNYTYSIIEIKNIANLKKKSI